MNSTSIHKCKNIVIENHMPENSNMVTLRIDHDVLGVDKAGQFAAVNTDTQISLFGLPTEVTDKLIEAFGRKPDESETS